MSLSSYVHYTLLRASVLLLPLAVLCLATLCTAMTHLAPAETTVSYMTAAMAAEYVSVDGSGGLLETVTDEKCRTLLSDGLTSWWNHEEVGRDMSRRAAEKIYIKDGAVPKSKSNLPVYVKVEDKWINGCYDFPGARTIYLPTERAEGDDCWFKEGLPKGSFTLVAATPNSYKQLHLFINPIEDIYTGDKLLGYTVYGSSTPNFNYVLYPAKPGVLLDLAGAAWEDYFVDPKHVPLAANNEASAMQHPMPMVSPASDTFFVVLAHHLMTDSSDVTGTDTVSYTHLTLPTTD